MWLEDLYYRGAGRSGMRRYKELGRDWRQRTFGRRTHLFFWGTYGLLLIAAVDYLPGRWRFGVGMLMGAVGCAFFLLPQVVMPDHIARWERGAWGEQNTARQLRKLQKQGWLIRHDLASGRGNGNRDHIAAGPSVYLLDSKMLYDEVWVDRAGLHVRRVGASEDEYVVPSPTKPMAGSARRLEHELEAAVGFPVAIYPVVVIWGHFDAGAQWDGNVAYVDGDLIEQWLQERPVDLRDPKKRQAVQDWLRSQPRA